MSKTPKSSKSIKGFRQLKLAKGSKTPKSPSQNLVNQPETSHRKQLSLSNL